MTVAKYAQTAIQEAVGMLHGEELWLTFSSVSERESFRTTFYKERRRLAKSLPAAAQQITISQKSDETGIYLILKKDEQKSSFSGIAYKVKPGASEPELVDLNIINEMQDKILQADKTARQGPMATLPLIQKQARVIMQMKEDGLIKPEYMNTPNAGLAEKLLKGELSWQDVEAEKEQPKIINGEPTLCAMIAAVREAGDLKTEYENLSDEEIAYKIINDGIPFEEIAK